MPAALALAFPGQGSLTPGAGLPWVGHDAFVAVRDVADAAGVDVEHLVTEAGEDELVSTENAQLATFALSLCVLDATGLEPRAAFVLGHSLGEYTALVAAGMLARTDAARLVAARGAAMREASTAAPGGLVALLGGSVDDAEAACKAIDGLFLANLNGPGQIVVGGGVEALASLEARVKELGFRRAIPLRVGGAFHTPLMAPAAAVLGPALDAAGFARGHAAVVANVDGRVHDDPDDWASLLLRQLTEPVRFDACVAALPAGSVVVECGPGAVLQGLIKRIRTDLDQHSVGSPDDLMALDALDELA
ncbi:MAG TPA: ACP S-malonyltransferase [Acidimicrobiales bacterium]|nr:ACP S-malonyltransferase [Acidimicrobiales bacterium]